MSASAPPVLYRHTQVGYASGLGLAVAAVASLGIGARTRRPAVMLAGAFIAALLALFGTLTVTVDPGAVELAFGLGLIRRRFPTKEIWDWRVVRNPWYAGWGIRWLPEGLQPGRGIWLFNVSGLEAVELHLRSGGRIRIGSDQAADLGAAIDRAKAWIGSVPGAGI